MPEGTGRTRRRDPEATREALIEAARALFTERGFAAASTPQIAAATGTTRGALYHHFRDKRELFRAVVEEDAGAVADAIAAATAGDMEPRVALVAGSRAYLEAMAASGRTRLLLVEGPAVLGTDALEAVDEANALGTLREGLRAAMPTAEPRDLDALAVLLSAAFDRAAIAIEGGADAETISRAMLTLIERVVGVGR